MAKVIGKICAPTGTYIKEGVEKTSWTKCGILMETDKGFRVKMDVYPIGGDGWFSVFEEEDRRQGSAKQTSSQATQEVGKDEDMPF